MRVRRYGGWLVVAGVAAVSVALSRLEAVRDIGAGPALILILTMLALWATGVIAEYLTAMVFFTAAILLGIASPEVTFSGFSSTAFWLIFPGLFIGVAVNQTGLGDRLARRLLARFPKSYVGVVFGNALLGVAMAFIMPSAMGRILLLLPIFAAIATRLGYQPRTRPYVGVVLSGIFGTFFPAVTILPANVPNVVITSYSIHYTKLYEHDLVEEVLRVVGYDTVPATPMPRLPMPAVALTDGQRRRSWMRRGLAARGLTEAVTFSFMDSRQASAFGWSDPMLKVDNPIS